MKYLFRYIIIMCLLISLTACDIASELLTTNHFEQFKDINPFSLVLSEESWEYDEAKILEFTAAALSEDNSDEFYDMLAERPTYRDAVTESYRTLLATLPNKADETYITELAEYQRRALALARIEVYTRGASAVDGFNDLYASYLSGEIETSLTQENFITNVFRHDSSDSVDQLEADIYGSVRAGFAFEKLGLTIEDKDNPVLDIIEADDAVIVLLSGMIYRIVELTIQEGSSQTEDQIITQLSNNIYVNNFATEIKFPQDVVKSANVTFLEHYLTEGVALVYTATGYELPSISLLDGGAL